LDERGEHRNPVLPDFVLHRPIHVVQGDGEGRSGKGLHHRHRWFHHDIPVHVDAVLYAALCWLFAMSFA